MQKSKTWNGVALGKFTDFNVWESALTETEMKDFTTCKSGMQGNLIAWNINDWKFTDGISMDELSIEKVNYTSLCSNTMVISVLTSTLGTWHPIGI